jgi:hypothetical protein
LACRSQDFVAEKARAIPVINHNNAYAVGSYAALTIGDFELATWKSFVTFEPLLPFSPGDYQSGTIVDEDGNKWPKYSFSTSVRKARERLDERGVTLSLCRRLYTEFRSDYLSNFSLKPGTQKYEHTYEENTLDFDGYYSTLGKIFRSRKTRWFPAIDIAHPDIPQAEPRDLALISREDFFCDDLQQYFSDAVVCLELRLFLEIADPDQKVELDFSDLVDGGYLDKADLPGLFGRFFDLMLRRIALDYEIYGFVLKEDPRVDTRLRQKLEMVTEDQLIDGVLLPLFSRMGFERLRRVGFHGPNEFGSDILPFRRRTPIGTHEYYALQAKAVPIHGTSSRKGNAAEVLSQATQALAVTFVDDLDNERKRVDKFVVACSKGISSAARRVIEDAIESKRAVAFLDQGALIDLIKENLLVQHVLFTDFDQEKASKPKVSKPNRKVRKPCKL